MRRLLIDANISIRTAEYARMLGIDAVHVTEIGLASAEDELILDEAIRDHRILMTFDHDFIRLLRTRQGIGLSLILFRLSDQSTPSMNAALGRLIRSGAWELIDSSGIIVTVNEHRIRIRSIKEIIF